uniref:cGMP-dependent protein kinase n=1 Tax=Helicotheca tamesis TaxID=374047 RepID=A0A7S2MVM4_9STRA|mmetsp:Transcript_4249/g.5783  ORF Transcript_4249/g.5783 Transcript_4249/m.5783 type:complete len:357 (-) Transcript_4249:306-1376(-)
MLGALSLAAAEAVIGDMSRLGKASDMNKLDKNVKLEDLKRHRILGVGTFGQVWMCSLKTDKTKVYALKIQNKRELLGHHQVDGVIREKNVMASLDHPFVIKLVNTFQDDKSLYMLLNLVQGGELFSILHTNSRDGVKENSAKFYSACILKGLAYMHDRHILYRDLKPENVLIDGEGYTVIVDLGFAKVVMDKTYTLCGTPLYLAPEVILSRGHDKGADYWSLGVLIYEMIVGGTPFFDSNIDQITLFKRIVRGQFAFPPMKMSPESQDIIKRLIEKKPTERLGTFARGHEDISEHPWFKNVDFSKIAKKEITAPWIPKIKNSLDATNFDSWDHLEDATKKKTQPLSAREQKRFEAF